MNKKSLSLLCLLCLAFALVACGKQKTEAAQPEAKTPSVIQPLPELPKPENGELPEDRDIPVAPVPEAPLRSVPCIHSALKKVTTEPGCEKDGMIEYRCEQCGILLRSEKLTALGHVYQYRHDEDEHWKCCALCGKSMKKEKHSFQNGVCSVCGFGCDHRYATTVVAPNCTSGGYSVHECAACGLSYRDSFTAATGHSYEADTTAASCTEPGTVSYTCKLCGESYAETMPALGHRLVSDASRAADCIHSGLAEGSHCERCGAVLTAQSVIPPTGIHSYVNGVCSICGEPEAMPTEAPAEFELPEDEL